MVLLVTVALIVPLWLAGGVPIGQSLAALFAWIWTVLLPGWVLTRAMRGKSRSWLTEFALSAAVGTVVSTVVWLALVAAGWTGAFLAWPLLTLLLLTIRRNEILDFSRPELPVDTLSGLAAAFAVAMGYRKLALGLVAPTPLPSGSFAWYQDMYWHLGLAQELGRSMPPIDPQVYGSVFWYHWFANAHSAALAAAGGLDSAIAFTRIWQPLVTLTVILLLFAAAEILTKKLWPGLVAVVVGYSTGIAFTWFSLPGHNGMSIPFSPSHQWALVPMLLCIIAAAELLDSERRLAPVLLFSVGTLGLMGGKSSSLPVIICGLLLALVLAWFVQRSLCRWIMIMLGIAIVGFTISTVLTSTANSGGEIQILASVDLTAPWKLHLTDYPKLPEAEEKLWIPGIGYNGGATLLLTILLTYLVAFGASWIALPLLKKRLSAWFLLGVGFAGFSAMMLVQVGGESQLYFMRGALPGWALLAAVGSSAAWTSARRIVDKHVALLVVLLAAGLGFLTAGATKSMQTEPETNAHLAMDVARPVIAYVVCLTLFVIVVRFVARHLTWIAAASFVLGGQSLGFSGFSGVDVTQLGTVAAALLVVLSAAGLITSTRRPDWLPAAALLLVGVMLLFGTLTEAIVAAQRTLGPPTMSRKYIHVSAAESSAAKWADDNLPDDAVIATNVHCNEAPEREGCPLLGFWVAPLTGKRVFIGAWPYTAEAHARHLVNGLTSRQQPFHDTERFELNERSFTDPSVELLDELQGEGVTHLFAVANRTDVSPALDEFADEVFSNDEVAIYELR